MIYDILGISATQEFKISIHCLSDNPIGLIPKLVSGVSEIKFYWNGWILAQFQETMLLGAEGFRENNSFYILQKIIGKIKNYFLLKVTIHLLTSGPCISYAFGEKLSANFVSCQAILSV